MLKIKEEQSRLKEENGSLKCSIFENTKKLKDRIEELELQLQEKDQNGGHPDPLAIFSSEVLATRGRESMANLSPSQSYLKASVNQEESAFDSRLFENSIRVNTLFNSMLNRSSLDESNILSASRLDESRLSNKSKLKVVGKASQESQTDPVRCSECACTKELYKTIVNEVNNKNKSIQQFTKDTVRLKEELADITAECKELKLKFKQQDRIMDRTKPFEEIEDDTMFLPPGNQSPYTISGDDISHSKVNARLLGEMGIQDHLTTRDDSESLKISLTELQAKYDGIKVKHVKVYASSHADVINHESINGAPVGDLNIFTCTKNSQISSMVANIRSGEVYIRDKQSSSQFKSSDKSTVSELISTVWLICFPEDS